MTTMHATAIISAVDRASAVFARVGANAHALAGRFHGVVGRLNDLGSAASLGMVTAGAAMGGFTLRRQYEVDKLAAGIRSFGDLSKEAYGEVHTAAQEAALKYGHSLGSMLEATKEAVQAGIEGEKLVDALDAIGAAARRNQEPVGSMTKMLIRTGRALGYEFGTREEAAASLAKASDLLSVAPTISTDSMPGFFSFLKYYAPIAKVLKQDEAQIAALAATAADLGFAGEEGGAGMRTIAARFVSMSPKTKAALRGEGVELDRMFSMDPEKLFDMKALQEQLAGAGLTGVSPRQLQRFGSGANFGSMHEWRDQLVKSLTSDLGIKKGDVENRKALTAIVEQFTLRAIKHFDWEMILAELNRKDTSLYTDAELAGKQRVQILEALKKNPKLYAEKLAQARAKTRGATQRGLQATVGTLHFEMDRVGAAWSVFTDRMFKAGSESVITRWATGLADGLASLSRADPARLNQIAVALGALVAVPAGALAISTIGAGLATLAGGLVTVGSAFARAPLLGKLLAGGGMLALLGLASDITPEVAESLSDFGTQLTGLATELGAVGTNLAGVGREIKQLLNIDPESSILVAGLQGVNQLLETMAASVKFGREGAEWLLGSRKLEDISVGEEGSLRRRARDAYMNEVVEGLRSKPKPLPPLQLLRDDPRYNPALRPDFARPIGVLGGVPVKVEGQVSGKMDLTIKVEAPDGLNAYVLRQSGGQVSGKLDTGRSMADTASGGEP